MSEFVPPCVGSGFCCKQSPCWEALRKFSPAELGGRFGDGGAGCPALRSRDGRHWCGLVEDADEEERCRLKESLHIGAGCCSSMNSDRTKLLGAGEEAARVELALRFCRRIVRQSSLDRVWLCMSDAAREMGIPNEKAMQMMRGVLRQSGSAWPEGFM